MSHLSSRRSSATSSDPRNLRLGILVVGDEAVASTRYRILAHLPALRGAGYEPKVGYQKQRPTKRLLRFPFRFLDEIRDIREASDSDLLLIHRRCYPRFFGPLLRRTNHPVVFDVDDAIYLPSPAESDSRISRYRYRRNFETTVSAADLVLCGNRELSDKVGDNPKLIVPTAVDCSRFHPGVVGSVDSLKAGWVGHSSNLTYLEAIAGPLREIARRHPGFKLIVVADRRPRIEGVPVEYRRWTLENEIECFKGISIGLMPLDDSEWSRAKCAFKLLQYMALGISSVASPVGMNREVIENGRNGLLAASNEDWVESLDELIGRPRKRREIGRAGRATVERSFDLPVISGRLIKALRSVADQESRISKVS